MIEAEMSEKKDALLEISNIKKVYCGDYQLNNISIRLEAGSALALLGKQFAGKTQLLELISGRSRADEGFIRLKGVALDRLTAAGWKAVSYVPDDILYYEDRTVKRLLERTIHWHAQSAAQRSSWMDEALGLCGQFGIDIHAKLLSLSVMENKCVALINALSMHPELLLVDELYHGLDETTYLKLLDIIDAYCRKGMAVIYACDEYDKISGYCDSTVLLSEGDCIFAGAAARDGLPAQMVSIYLDELLDQDIHEFNSDNEVFGFVRECRDIALEGKVRYFNKKVCFPYKGDMTELSYFLYEHRCRNYQVEELTFEEEVLRNYERWS